MTNSFTFDWEAFWAHRETPSRGGNSHNFGGPHWVWMLIHIFWIVIIAHSCNFTNVTDTLGGAARSGGKTRRFQVSIVRCLRKVPLRVIWILKKYYYFQAIQFIKFLLYLGQVRQSFLTPSTNDSWVKSIWLWVIFVHKSTDQLGKSVTNIPDLLRLPPTCCTHCP